MSRWSAGLAQSSFIHAQDHFLDGRFHASLASLAHADNGLVALADDISVPFPLVIGFGCIGFGEFGDLERLGLPERGIHWQYFG